MTSVFSLEGKRNAFLCWLVCSNLCNRLFPERLSQILHVLVASPGWIALAITLNDPSILFKEDFGI